MAMGRVKFGFCLPLIAGAGAQYETIDYSALQAAVLECEALGFDAFWVADHLILGLRGAILECWTVLSALAVRTAKLRLGSLVLCPAHRHPAVTAKMAATLDVISKGRLEFGIGAGWNEDEQEAYGLPWAPSARVRIEQMVEGIEIAKRMWTTEQPSYHGRYYAIHNAICEPKPVQKPHPPIWIGGKGERRMLRAVARYADGWNTTPMPVETYRHKLDVLRNHCRELHTDYDAIVKSIEQRIVVGRDEAAVRRTLSRGNIFLPAKWSLSRTAADAFIIGTPDTCIERLAEYVDAEVEQFMLWFLDFASMEGIRLFATEVLPSF